MPIDATSLWGKKFILGTPILVTIIYQYHVIMWNNKQMQLIQNLFGALHFVGLIHNT